MSMQKAKQGVNMIMNRKTVHDLSELLTYEIL